MTMSINYGKALKEARNKKHFSLKYVSEKTGITDSRLSRIENSADSNVWKDLKELGCLMHLYELEPDFILSFLEYDELATFVSRLSSLSESDKTRVLDFISNLNTKTVFRLGELFSGPGGLAWGAMHARISDPRFKVVHAWANDFDEVTCQTYTHNICPDNPKSVICHDIRTLDISTLGEIDALAFGFPCNDFSQVGEKKGLHGTFGPLYTYGAKALKIYKPLWFMAENVGGLQSDNGGDTLKLILRDLKACGYKIFPHLYKFEEYGVPQMRHRIIIIGIRDDLPYEYKVPSTVPYSKINVTCKNAIENPPIPTDAFNNELTAQNEKVVKRLQYIRPGQNAFNADMPDELRLNVKGAKISQIYKRLDPDRPAYTVTGSGGGGTHIYHWEEPRALTNRERARLQTFPDEFKFEGKKEQVRKQIGMAVPCKGAQIIIEAVLNTFAGIEYPSVPCNIKVEEK